MSNKLSMSLNRSCRSSATSSFLKPRVPLGGRNLRLRVKGEYWRQPSPCRSLMGRMIFETRCMSLRHSGRRSGVVCAASELSYIMVKPDGVQRGLVGKVIARFEDKGFKLKGLKMFQASRDLAEEHYGELKERPFFPKLVDYILSGPVVCMAWEGDGVVASARKMIGKTDPLEAEPGTIRGDLAVHKGRNVVHGSDSPTNGIREIGLWFDEDELIEWKPTLEPWILESD